MGYLSNPKAAYRMRISDWSAEVRSSDPTKINLFGDEYGLTERIGTKARSIRIEVRPDRGVSLIYPRWVARVEALTFLRSREAWIRDKLAEMAQQASAYPAPGRNRWDGSDRIRLRGRELPLKWEAAR